MVSNVKEKNFDFDFYHLQRFLRSLRGTGTGRHRGPAAPAPAPT